MSWVIAAPIAGSAIVGAGVSAYSNKKASEASERGNNKAIAATTAATEQAREDVNRLFPQAQRTANAGFNSAQDIFQQMMPMQQQAFQGGNMGAQQAILAGMPQIQNALLGGNIDYSAFQPYQAQTPAEFDFTKINQMKALSNLPLGQVNYSSPKVEQPVKPTATAADWGRMQNLFNTGVL